MELLHSYGLWPLAHQPYFPMLQHSGINYPPATGWSPFLSRKELRFANFPFDSFRILIFYKETFHFSPRNLRIEDFADSSRRLADLWTLCVYTGSKMARPFLPTANNVCGLYPFSPERETFCKLSLCGSFEFLSLYKKDLSMEVFFFWFHMKEVHWTSCLMS